MSLARLFYRPHYTSQAAQLIAQLKQDAPDLAQAQRQGRARLWDVELNRELMEQFSAAQVAQRPYVYVTGADGGN
jgi:hypothetical protein